MFLFIIFIYLLNFLFFFCLSTFPNFYKKIIGFSCFKVQEEKKTNHRPRGWRKHRPPAPPQGMWVNRGNERLAAGKPRCSQNAALSPGPAGSSVTTFLIALHPLSTSEVKTSMEPQMSKYPCYKIKCNLTNAMILICCYKINDSFWLPGKDLLFTNVLCEPPKPPLSECYVPLLLIKE